MTIAHFPADAFLPAPGLMQSLAQIFGRKAYGPADIAAIRTSVYYSDFAAEKDGALAYTIAIGHALREDDGSFSVMSSRYRVTDNIILSSRSVDSIDDDAHNAPVTCSEKNVLATLWALNETLSAQAAYGLAFPERPPVMLHDSIHLRTAYKLFEEPCSTEDIVYHEKWLGRGFWKNPAFG